MFVDLAATVWRNDRCAIKLEENCRTLKRLANGELIATVKDSLKDLEPSWYAENALVRFYACQLE